MMNCELNGSFATWIIFTA